MAIPLIIGAAVAIGGSISSAISAKNKRERAEALAKDYERQLKSKEDSRQDIIDPSDHVRDLSGMITNPFANLQVATGAAEIQAEEADIALATSLDTLTQTGAGAGGATALAMAALRSKQGISASIEQQEAQNSRLRAQGQQQMQGMMMQEAGRVQGARMQGAQFAFGMQEQREMQQIDRLAAMMGNEKQAANQYGMAQQQAIMSGVGAVGGALMGAGTAQMSGQYSVGGSKNNPGTNYQYQNYQLPSGTGGSLYTPQNFPTKNKIPMSSCFTKGSLIKMFDGTLKAIENIKIGEWIRTGANKKGVVKQTLIHPINDKINIYRHNETGVTGNHWVFLAGEWMPARRLREMFNWDKKHELVNNVYNLEIKGDDKSYITNNIIVSGKL